MARPLMVVCVAAFAMAGLAHATPPEFTQVRETILGHTDTEVFILRTTGDNLGSYYQWQTTTVLIARDIETGVDQTVWPVMNVIDGTAYYAENGSKSRMLNLADGAQFNPFDVLITAGAYDLMPLGQTGATMTDGVIIVENTRITTADAAAQVTTSVAATRELLPPKQTGGMGDALDPILHLEFEPASDCQASDQIRLARPLPTDGGEPPPPAYAVRLTCTAMAAETLDLDIYVILPPALSGQP